MTVYASHFAFHTATITSSAYHYCTSENSVADSILIFGFLCSRGLYSLPVITSFSIANSLHLFGRFIFQFLLRFSRFFFGFSLSFCRFFSLFLLFFKLFIYIFLNFFKFFFKIFNGVFLFIYFFFKFFNSIIGIFFELFALLIILFIRNQSSPYLFIKLILLFFIILLFGFDLVLQFRDME